MIRQSEQLDIGQALELSQTKEPVQKDSNCFVRRKASVKEIIMSSLVFYPTSPKEALVKEFVGKSIAEVPTPAAVMNVAAARRNCERMLEAAKKLDLGWRAHVKTHKVSEEFLRIGVRMDGAN